jgi:stress-induced morphogen
MILEADLTQLLKNAFPDADIALADKTGMQDHYALYIASKAFDGKNLIQQRQMVYKVVDAVLKDGRLHALEIKTDVPA